MAGGCMEEGLAFDPSSLRRIIRRTWLTSPMALSSHTRSDVTEVTTMATNGVSSFPPQPGWWPGSRAGRRHNRSAMHRWVVRHTVRESCPELRRRVACSQGCGPHQWLYSRCAVGVSKSNNCHVMQQQQKSQWDWFSRILHTAVHRQDRSIHRR